MANLVSIQITSSADLADNFLQIERQLDAALNQLFGPSLVVLPECFSLFGVNGSLMGEFAETYGNGQIQAWLSDMAKKYACFLVGGTIPIVDYAGMDNNEVARTDERYCASSLVFSPQGKCISRYDKIHLFDVDVADKTKAYRESRFTKAGRYLALFDTPFADVAQCVCYDLRFSQMFAAYTRYTDSGRAPQIIVAPSAFTKATGKAHWHALLQARSIENQCFVVASNQVGRHADKRETFGHSCIYSPWGECLDIVRNTPGFAVAKFDQAQIQEIRANMPIWSHKKERYILEP